MARLSERPAESNDIRNPPLKYRVNKALASLYCTVFHKKFDYLALDPEASLQELLKSGKSFIRFGDGEGKLMLGGPHPTQVCSKALVAGLRRILADYAADSPYLLGVANLQLSMDFNDLKKTNRHRIWRNARYCLRKHLRNDSGLPYLEANMFRKGPTGLAIRDIERLWRSKSQIIIIHNHSRHQKWFQARYPDKQTYFVQVPEKNAFESIDRTQARVLELVDRQHLTHASLAILIAAGAGGKVLNYNLCRQDANLCCYDMGNFFHMYTAWPPAPGGQY